MPDPTRRTVSATQVPMLFGLSPWGTPWTVYQYLREGIAPEAASEAAEIGRAMQPVVLKLASKRLSLDVEDNDQDLYYRHREYPLGCTVDGLVRCPSRGLGVVEVKCVREQSFRDAWADGPPPYVRLQTQVQMLVLGAEWGTVAALEGGHTLHLFQVAPLTDDERFRVLEQAKEMLRRVEEGRPPDPFGDPPEWPVAVALTKRLGGEAIVTLPDDATKKVEALRRASRIARMAKTEYERARNSVLALMNGARRAITSDGKYELVFARRSLRVKGDDNGTEQCDL